MENAPLLANTWHNLNVMYQKANATFCTRHNSWAKGQEEPSQEPQSHLTDMVLLVDLHDWTRHLRQFRYLA